MVRELIALAVAACACALLAPVATATPIPVKAFYMFAPSPASLAREAYYHGKYFAQHEPAGQWRVLMLDFGAARKIDSDTWGTRGFSGTLFKNSDILQALKGAADGFHYGNSSGYVSITYGNSNYHLTKAGMGTTAAWYAGYYQSYRAKQLSEYQTSRSYRREWAAAGSDMEPSWEGPTVTRQLVNGDNAHGFTIYYDYGSADGCPWTGSSGSCNNGWDMADIAYVSYNGLAWGLPEIYYTVNADQWTVARRLWDNNHASTYTFAGITAEAGAGLTPAQSWDALAARNPGRVGNELICFC